MRVEASVVAPETGPLRNSLGLAASALKAKGVPARFQVEAEASRAVFQAAGMVEPIL